MIIGAVLAIPSARAEVLKWFGASSPVEYLTTDESERPEIPEIEALVSTPEPEKNVTVPIPIEFRDSGRVGSETARAISDFLYENCDVELGSAIYDGEQFYQSIRFNGLSAMYLIPPRSIQFSVPVDPYAVWSMYERGPEEKYLNGEETLYEYPYGYIWYELPDGKRWRSDVEIFPALPDSLKKAINEIVPGAWNEEVFTEEQEKQLYDAKRSYLENNGWTGVAIIDRPRAFGLNRYIDESGNLTVKVLYEVSVIEADRDPDTELFWADLGSITINMNAEESLNKRQLNGPEEPVSWDAETVVVTADDFDYGVDESADDNRVVFSKYRLSTEGVVFTAETEHATIDALAIRDVRIRAVLPDAWTDAERNAFIDCLRFRIQIDGEGDQFVWLGRSVRQADGSVVWFASKIGNLSFETLRSATKITLRPELYIMDSIEICDDDWNVLETLDPAFGETAVSQPGVRQYRGKDHTDSFPQYAITLTVAD